MKPLVSAIIPTFNRQGTILRAVRSVQQQTYKNVELLVIDDGSSDNTKQVLGDLIENKFIKYFYQPNGGASKARNLGLKNSSGDWVTFLDSDDEFSPTKIEKQINLLIKNGLEISLTNSKIVEQKPLTVENSDPPAKTISRIDLIRRKGALITLMIKRDTALSLKFDEALPSSNDFDFVLRATENKQVIFINEPLYLVHKHLEKNRLSSNYQFKIPGFKRVLKKIYRGDYKLNETENQALNLRVQQNLGLFTVLSGNFIKGRAILKESFKYEKGDFSIQYHLIYFLTYIPLLLRLSLIIAKGLWKINLIKV